MSLGDRSDSGWIDACTACELLGVKAQTLYTYVGRRQVRARADDGDRRRSLYARADIEALLAGNRRPRARSAVAARAIRWGDPVLATAISELRGDMLWLRNRSLGDCADRLGLEGVAAHLWGTSPARPAVGNGTAPRGPTPLRRALRLLSDRMEGAPAMQGRAPSEIAADGFVLLSEIADALSGRSLTGPIHRRLARAWGVDATGQDELRRALVLLSEHELNPSTFAVRIAASTGASLPAALACGLATLSGPRHGGVAARTRQMLQAVQAEGVRKSHEARAGQPPYGFGFGHPLYPEGDPRARYMLDRLPARSGPVLAVRALSEALGEPPNIDAALAALALVRDLPEEAPLVIFATGRMVGWTAHAIEQVQDGAVIRPRARYQTAPEPQ